MSSILTILICTILICAVENYKLIGNGLAAPGIQQLAAEGVVKRILPNDYHKFSLMVNYSLPLNTFKLQKTRTSDKVYIEASSGTIACKGFYYYLRHYCNSQVAWEGSNINLPKILPPVNIISTSPSKYIYYQNVCTWGYSFVWWREEHWRRHIDWMALHGITLTIAPIQEHVWEKVYSEMGLTQDEIDQFFTGPAYLPWNRMGNIKHWNGPLSQNYKIYSNYLQKYIIKELNNLGTRVALPAFDGYVPDGMKRLFPNATFDKTSCWNNISPENCSPLFVNPSEPLFKTIGTKFLSNIIEEYGSNHIYMCDPFNEMIPEKNDAEYISSVSRSIYQSMIDVDPQAIWLMQAWILISAPDFWTNNVLKPFLTAVPRGRIILLDLMSEQYPKYGKTRSYFGQPFIWNMLHNFGGTIGMRGSMQSVNEKIEAVRLSGNFSMIGVGITPEGINQNYIMYDFALDRAWDQSSVDLDNWIDGYVTSRYIFPHPNLNKGWRHLKNSVYNYSVNWFRHHGHFPICKMPSLKIKPWTWYDRSIIVDVWKQFVQVSSLYGPDELYKYDLIDITRQYFQDKFDDLYLRATVAIYSKDYDQLERIKATVNMLFEDVDSILGTHVGYLFGPWLMDAKKIGQNHVEKQMLDINARTQVSVWIADETMNPHLNDYAIKQWAGVIKDYCAERWSYFILLHLNDIRKKSNTPESLIQTKIYNEVSLPFTTSTKSYETKPIGDAISLSLKFYEKWIINMKETLDMHPADNPFLNENLNFVKSNNV